MSGGIILFTQGTAIIFIAIVMVANKGRFLRFGQRLMPPGRETLLDEVTVATHQFLRWLHPGPVRHRGALRRRRGRHRLRVRGAVRGPHRGAHGGTPVHPLLRPAHLVAAAVRDHARVRAQRHRARDHRARRRACWSSRTSSRPGCSGRPSGSTPSWCSRRCSSVPRSRVPSAASSGCRWRRSGRRCSTPGWTRSGRPPPSTCREGSEAAIVGPRGRSRAGGARRPGGIGDRDPGRRARRARGRPGARRPQRGRRRGGGRGGELPLDDRGRMEPRPATAADAGAGATRA